MKINYKAKISFSSKAFHRLSKNLLSLVNPTFFVVITFLSGLFDGITTTHYRNWGLGPSAKIRAPKI